MGNRREAEADPALLAHVSGWFRKHIFEPRLGQKRARESKGPEKLTRRLLQSTGEHASRGNHIDNYLQGLLTELHFVHLLNMFVGDIGCARLAQDDLDKAGCDIVIDDRRISGRVIGGIDVKRSPKRVFSHLLHLGPGHEHPGFPIGVASVDPAVLGVDDTVEELRHGNTPHIPDIINRALNTGPDYVDLDWDISSVCVEEELDEVFRLGKAIGDRSPLIYGLSNYIELLVARFERQINGHTLWR